MENPETAARCRNCRHEFEQAPEATPAPAPAGNDPWAGAVDSSGDPDRASLFGDPNEQDFSLSGEDDLPPQERNSGDFDRSMFGENTVDLSSEAADDAAPLELDDAEAALDPVNTPLGATPPGMGDGAAIGGPPLGGAPPGMPPGGPPLGGPPPGAPPGFGAPPPDPSLGGAVPNDAPSAFDTSSFAPAAPTGPPPEAYERFDEAWFQESLSLLPDPKQVHGSRARSASGSGEDFFHVEPTPAPESSSEAPAGYRPPSNPKKPGS